MGDKVLIYNVNKTPPFIFHWPQAAPTRYYISHDSVSVVRTTFKVYGKRQTLTLSQPKTPELIVT